MAKLHELGFNPGKSFGLKFISNQSDLFRNLFPRQSELIRVNPKKVFNLVWCNSVKNQSESIRDWIQMNLDQSFNPNESEVRILRIDSDWLFRLNHSDLGFIWIKNFFRIHLDSKSRIESDWLGMNFNPKLLPGKLLLLHPPYSSNSAPYNFFYFQTSRSGSGGRDFRPMRRLSSLWMSILKALKLPTFPSG